MSLVLVLWPLSPANSLLSSMSPWSLSDVPAWGGLIELEAGPSPFQIPGCVSSARFNLEPRLSVRPSARPSIHSFFIRPSLLGVLTVFSHAWFIEAPVVFDLYSHLPSGAPGVSCPLFSLIDSPSSSTITHPSTLVFVLTHHPFIFFTRSLFDCSIVIPPSIFLRPSLILSGLSTTR